MSTSSIAAVWSPVRSVRPVRPIRPVVRLTRRGRLMRSLAAIVVLFGLVAAGAERMTGEPARAVSGPTAPIATASVVVEQGDSLWQIAQAVAPGRDPREVVSRIRELNGLSSNLIQPGQVLLVPTLR